MMNYTTISNTALNSSRIILGCMRIADKPLNQIEELIDTAVELGINTFDHADIYGNGESERAFARALELVPSQREKLILQSKCGIIPGGMYDFSYDHIMNSVDGILKRLNTEYLDILLLHRPDALIEPEEVAEAFSRLHDSGKVRNFGVSNHSNSQIELINHYSDHKMIVNQVQYSPTFTNIIDSGLYTNSKTDQAVMRHDGIVEYSRIHNITLQAWSPFGAEGYTRVFLDHPDYVVLNKTLEQVGNELGVSKSAAAISWILRHPAGMQAVIGTTNAERLRDIVTSTDVAMDREQWYRIYRSAGNQLL